MSEDIKSIQPTKNKRGFLSGSVAERREAILSGTPSKVLLALSLPTLLMALVQSLIPLSDGLFLNNSGGHIVASAVGVSATVINMLNALSQGLGAAAMAIIGQLNGLGDFKKVRHVIAQIFAFGLLLGVALGFLMLPIAHLSADLLNAKEHLREAITTYLTWYAPTIPLLFMAAIFNSVKNATGMPEVTFARMILLLILKIVFNTLFLTILHLGVRGAALASFCSYAVVSVWMFYDLAIKPGEMRLDFHGFRFDGAEISQLVKLGLPTMISSFMINLGFFLINRETVKFGAIALNAQTISSNINAMAFTIPSSIGTTITTMVSINIAAGREDRARRSYWSGIGMSMIVAVIICAIFVPLAPFLVRLFLHNPEMAAATKNAIFDIAVPSLNIYTGSVFGFALFMVTQGAIIGLGKTRIPLFMGILRIWLIRYIFILIFAPTMGIFAIFWGNLVSNVLAGLIFMGILLKSNWTSNLIHVQNRNDKLKAQHGTLPKRFGTYPGQSDQANKADGPSCPLLVGASELAEDEKEETHG